MELSGNRFFPAVQAQMWQLKLHPAWMDPQWKDQPMEGCLVSPGEVRDWGQVWSQLLWGVWEPVLGLRSWCQGSPVPWGGEDPAGNHLGKSQLPREGKAPDKRGRRCGVCVIPASKTLWWRFAPQAGELGPISCFKVPLPSEICYI